MDLDAEHSTPVEVLAAILLGTRSSHGNGVYELEVTRVKAEREVHRVPTWADDVRAIAEMVLNIAATKKGEGVFVGKLGKDLSRILAHDIGENVEAAPVGHHDDDFFHAVVAGDFERLGQERDDALGAFQRKLLEPINFF